MKGAIIGDIIGSAFEVYNLKRKDFLLFSNRSGFTDDTVMTVAVARALVRYAQTEDEEIFRRALVEEMVKYGERYPAAGYGEMFAKWLTSPHPAPYGSFGNGSAMRVSPVGFFASSLAEAERLAEISASVTHDHPEGIRGAQAIAAAIYLARRGKSKEEIRGYIERHYYDLSVSIDEARPHFTFIDTCPATVPFAIRAFLESRGYEDTVRTAVSLGGDSDTLAAMAGGIAEAYWGIPDEIMERGLSYLDDMLTDEVEELCDYLFED